MTRKRIHIGDFDLGTHSVRLFALPGEAGGSFDMAPDFRMAEMCIGLKYKHWGQVVATVLHEAMEFALVEVCGRYMPSPDYANDNGAFTFVVTHTQFSDACARASHLLTDALPKLATEYGRQHRTEKRTKPKHRRKGKGRKP